MRGLIRLIKRYTNVFVIVSIFVMFGALVNYWMILRIEMPEVNIVVEILVITLLIFLLILILRYFFLIWFSYLEHLEQREETTDDYVPYVSIIVPAYNEEKVIESSLMSLKRLDYPGYEIIVVDDGSTDRTYDLAKQMEGKFRNHRIRVYTKGNEGKGEALNFGIRLSSGQIVLCVDSDSRLSRKSLRYGVRHFTNPKVGAVAGNVKVTNRQNAITRLQALEYIEGLNMVRKAQAFFRSVNIIPGPIGFFRRETIEQVGYYDTDTFAEDADLTLKILVTGWQIRYEPYAIADTEAPENLGSLLKQRYRWTRGILQSISKRKRDLFSLRKGAVPMFTLWYMIFEGLIWPIMNIFSNMFLIFIAIVYGFSAFLVLWWLQLTLLDLATALHSNVMEREELLLVPYAIYYRLFYILIIDLCKLFATFEELFGVHMTWGKLTRLGRI
jgi:poly-beta-1,6 N-acetyl-D-glucosamine synthase